jgi:hypothetical protein
MAIQQHPGPVVEPSAGVLLDRPWPTTGVDVF